MMSIRRLFALSSIFFIFITTSLAQKNNLAAIANEELIALAKDLNYGLPDIEHIIVTDQYTSNGITHIYYQQTVNQIGIYGATASIHLKNGEVFASNLNFIKGLKKKSIKQQFQVQAVEAVIAVATAQNYPIIQNEVIVLEVNNEDPSKSNTISKSGISNQVIPLKLVFFENEQQELQLSWSMFIDEKKGGAYKNFLVNATTGSVEKEINLTISCSFDHDHSKEHPNSINHRLENILTQHKAVDIAKKIQVNNSYNVFPVPYESPNHAPGSNRFIEVSPWLANPTASPNGWHQIGSTNYTTTRGNNVDAYEDSNNNNIPTGGDTARVDGGANLEFNNPLDLSGDVTNYKAAAVTNLFYWNNIIHDIWYNYGFDEASGNFQEENFGTQGNNSDYVIAEAQNGTTVCNATMATPSDGLNPLMQMYACGGRDGDFDNGIIVHEYGHGISNRLVGGPSTTLCLNNEEQMGEGWSDWFGLVMTIQAGDTATKSRPVGTWLKGQTATGSGFRDYPYTTDMTINPMTYHTVTQTGIPYVHDVGSVWATMLWDLTWAMIEKYSWDADLYNGTGGNNKTMDLVIEGLKLLPCSPGFVDARNGILEADSILNGGENSLLIWETFARRGLGFSADQGSTSNRTDGVEAFDLPPYFKVSLKKTADKVTAKLGEEITYTLTASNKQDTPLNNLVFTDYLPNDLEFLSASDGGQANGQTITWPAVNLAVGASATRTLVATVREDLTPLDSLFKDDLESGAGNWQVITESGGGDWMIQTDSFASSDNALHCSNLPETTSVTNLVIASPYGITSETELIFNHNYDIESGTFSNGEIFGWDGAFVEISTDNGITWTDLGIHMDTINGSGYNTILYYGSRPTFTGKSDGWIKTIIDLSDYASQLALIRFQMRYDGSNSKPGWFIDDVEMTNLGLSLKNQAQISNGIVTSTTSVEQLTTIEFTTQEVCSNNSSMNMEGEITTNDYRVYDEITSTGYINNNAVVKFYAGNAITLLPDFHAKLSSDFLAKIEPCSTSTLLQDLPNTQSRSNHPLLKVSSNNSLTVNPNPFNQQAIINYQLANNSPLWIGLHDITGKVVKIIATQREQLKGSYQVIMNNEHIENGAYWLTMRTKEAVITKKVFLVKN